MVGISKYFNHLHSSREQALYRNLTNESLKISGVLVYYIPRTDRLKDNTPLETGTILSDDIFLESVKTSFESNYLIEVYFKNTSGDDGEDLLSKFGFQQPSGNTYVMGKDSFNELNIPYRTRPQEGDLIYMGDIIDSPTGYGSFTNKLYEITHVTKDVNTFWQLGRCWTYELTTQLFTFGYEKFQTGLEAVDQVSNDDNNSNIAEISQGINDALRIRETSLRDFSENNPFGGL